MNHLWGEGGWGGGQMARQAGVSKYRRCVRAGSPPSMRPSQRGTARRPVQASSMRAAPPSRSVAPRLHSRASATPAPPCSLLAVLGGVRAVAARWVRVGGEGGRKTDGVGLGGPRSDTNKQRRLNSWCAGAQIVGWRGGQRPAARPSSSCAERRRAAAACRRVRASRAPPVAHMYCGWKTVYGIHFSSRYFSTATWPATGGEEQVGTGPSRADGSAGALSAGAARAARHRLMRRRPGCSAGVSWRVLGAT